MIDANHDQVLHRLAAAYSKLLDSVHWQDEVIVRGLQEGLTKFLSNAWLRMVPGSSKYHKTHLISPAAEETLRTSNGTPLVFEHLVPKQQYIQKPCEALARKHRLRPSDVYDRLKSFWIVATITKDEDARLSRMMPDGWDAKDPFHRYRLADVRIHGNPFFAWPDAVKYPPT